MASHPAKDSYLVVGLWSALLITVLNIGSTVGPFLFPHAITGYALGLPVTLLFVVVMCALYSYASPDKKVFGLSAVAFAVACAALLGFNYFFMASAHRLQDVPSLLDLTNPNSIIWVVEILGYGFMGIATLCAAPVIREGALETWLRLLLIVNGALSVGGMLGYVLDLPLSIMIGGLLLWDVAFPVMTLCVALLFFKQLRNQSDMAR